MYSNIMESVKTKDGFTNHLNATLGSDKGENFLFLLETRGLVDLIGIACKYAFDALEKVVVQESSMVF